MIHKFIDKSSQKEIADFFRSVFTASEGETEGELIGTLAHDLASNVDNKDVICLGTYDDATLIGCIFFTRLKFGDPVSVFMLAPVAVSTSHQRQGVGQALINFGLEELKKRSVKIAITYGDPAYYIKTGFQPLSESTIQAPHKLSMPHGWIGQSLRGKPIPVIAGRPACDSAFDNPAYW